MSRGFSGTFLTMLLLASFGLGASGAMAAPEKKREDSTPASEDSSAHFGVGFVFGYEWGLPLSHRVSAGVILGDASTSGGGGAGNEPWFSFPGGGGRGLLLQAELGARALKLSAGFADAQMLYLPPASWGFAIKVSYLEPLRVADPFGSRQYLGAEIEVGRIATFSLGAFQGLDGEREVLVSWGVGIGF